MSPASRMEFMKSLGREMGPGGPEFGMGPGGPMGPGPNAAMMVGKMGRDGPPMSLSPEELMKMRGGPPGPDGMGPQQKMMQGPHFPDQPGDFNMGPQHRGPFPG